MRKRITKIIPLTILLLLFVFMFSVAVFAATAGSGYTIDGDGKETNIKWTMDASGTLTFEIDPDAKDKVQTTVIINKDPKTGSSADWSRCLPTYAEATKIIIGDGITEVSGFAALHSLGDVEIPKSLKILGASAFQCSTISSLYIRGNENTYALFDLSNIEVIGPYCFDGCYKLSMVSLNNNMKGEIPAEAFKGTALGEITIPEGITKIANRAFAQTGALDNLYFLGMETVIESDDVFAGNFTYPTIKAKTNSKALEFAIAGSYTYVDIDTGVKTQGEKPTTGISQGDIVPDDLPEFTPEGATLYGHMTGLYLSNYIINTFWAYYDETKTLELTSATKSYNETGTIWNCDPGTETWQLYKEQIEHIVIGDDISKITAGAFDGYTALKDVRLGKNVGQIDAGAFTNCASLSTIWRDGTERIEGVFDLSGISNFGDIITNTAPSELYLHENVKEIGFGLPMSLKTIYVPEVNDALIKYAEDNFYNLQSTKNPDDFYENHVEIDLSMTPCGARCVFDFDEATGTLTVYGVGDIAHVVNYYGGGSKTAPWFSIKQKVKHVVLSEHITSVGKYAFCEFKNLETVRLPSKEGFIISNAAFEKCHNLRSVYIDGTEPIEGTLDLSTVADIGAWSFAYDYLIANIVIDPVIEKIGSSVFEENITLNLKNVYGTPGSYAEEYAKENGLAFFDASSSIPEPIKCVPPETTGTDGEESAVETETATAEPEKPKVVFLDYVGEPPMESDSGAMLYIIIGCALAAIIAAVIIVIIKKRGARK